MLLIDSKTQQIIYRGSTSGWIGNIDSIGGGIITDSHGTWFGSGPNGIYLYSPGGTVQKISDVQWARPANGCF